MQTIPLNAHNIVLWKHPRDMAQIVASGNQMYPRKSKYFMEAYKSAQKREPVSMDSNPLTRNPIETNAYVFSTKQQTGSNLFF